MSPPRSIPALPRRVLRGVVALVGRAGTRLRRRYLLFRHRKAPLYRTPQQREFGEIERELRALDVPVRDWTLDRAERSRFGALYRFPDDYHGGVRSPVWNEKILEHFVAWRLLALGRPGVTYIDVAGASSPWAALLRQRGARAFSVDLRVPEAYRSMDFYVECDATRLPWRDATVDAMSLQCAYEMFLADSDTRFVHEAARVLKPGGAVVIVPLYMHTHACYYSTPEYYDDDLGDAGATKYLRKDSWNVPASRKYSPRTLVDRVLRPARLRGLLPLVHILRNPEDAGPGIYLRYFLTLTKPAAAD